MAHDFSKKPNAPPMDWLLFGSKGKESPTELLAIRSSHVKIWNRLNRFRRIGYSNFTVWEGRLQRKELR